MNRGHNLTPEEIAKMLRQVRRGKLSVEAAVDRLRTLPYEDLGYAKIDHHRSLRQGFPEVIFARGQAPEHVEGIVRGMLATPLQHKEPGPAAVDRGPYKGH